MNLKTIIPLAVAIVLGLVAAIVASQLVKQRPVAVSGPGQPIMNLANVVVAARDLPPGATLGSEDLKILRIEAASAPANVASNPSALFTRVAKVQIPAGQIVHESLLAERGVAGGLPGVIAPGYRAMTIEINEFTGVAGLIEPGNRIDIIARVADAEGTGQSSRTIVQNVPIIAVGPQLVAKNTSTEVAAAGPVVADAPPAPKVMPRSVTVLVTPEDAEKVDLATASNTARIVLRASTDTATAQVSGATVASLRSGASRAARPVPDVTTVAASKGGDAVFGPETKSPFKSGRVITVIRAGVSTEVDVDDAATPVADDSATSDATSSASAGE